MGNLWDDKKPHSNHEGDLSKHPHCTCWKNDGVWEVQVTCDFHGANAPDRWRDKPFPGECAQHKPEQHRDGKEPWCRHCGLTAKWTVPTSLFTKVNQDLTTYAAKVNEQLTEVGKKVKAQMNLISQASDPNAPKAADGLQSELKHRFDLIDADAMFVMSNILHRGAEKYGEDNWRKIPVEQHLNHLIGHVYAYLDGNTDDNHLGNALCRAMFALGRQLMDENGEIQE